MFDPITLLVGSTLLSSGVSAYGASKAASATKEAAGTQARAQMAQLEYLKEREAIPQQFREGALQQLGGLYGLEGGVGSQGQLIEQARQSPLYGAIMGGREAGEEAILRHQGATGGLRSGDTQAALYDYNTQLENQALLQSYGQQVQGLTGMANLPSGSQQIGQTMANIGGTQAMGIQGAGQAWQQGLQNVSGTIMRGVGLGIEEGII